MDLASDSNFFQLLQPGPSAPAIRPMDKEASLALLIFALLYRKPGSGPDFHSRVFEVLTGLSNQNIEENLGDQLARVSQKAGASCTAMAERMISQGYRAWLPRSWDSSPGKCPCLFFGKGSFSGSLTWIAVFNSRKPRIIPKDSEWLAGLRQFLSSVPSDGVGLVSSAGTLTYDMITAWSDRHSAPLLLFSGEGLDRLSLHSGERPGLTCLAWSNACSRRRRSACRDRFIAEIADIHVVLELRRSGNMAEVVTKAQEHRRRPLMVLQPVRSSPLNAGNSDLLERFAARTLVVERSNEQLPGKENQPRMGEGFVSADQVPWRDYLYHYTRSCPRQWPGQSRFDYALSLLDGDQGSSHSTLETLVRILNEKRLRSSGRLVRGNFNVVSWSSRPPMELQVLRTWNKGLTRWTFEPYGVAVTRAALKELGARPCMYIPERKYDSIPLNERFRFQRQDPPSCDWRSEREWRLPRDLDLSCLSPGDWFVFVPAPIDQARLLRIHELGCQVLILHPNHKL